MNCIDQSAVRYSCYWTASMQKLTTIFLTQKPTIISLLKPENRSKYALHPYSAPSNRFSLSFNYIWFAFTNIQWNWNKNVYLKTCNKKPERKKVNFWKRWVVLPVHPSNHSQQPNWSWARSLVILRQPKGRSVSLFNLNFCSDAN